MMASNRKGEISRANRYRVKASGATLAWVGGWVLVLALVCPITGAARDSRPEPPVRSDPEAGPQVEMDQPVEEPEVVHQKRGLFQRLGPQSLTAEQREEAERLKKLAAKYGTDPTALVGRLQLTSVKNCPGNPESYKLVYAPQEDDEDESEQSGESVESKS